MNKKDLIEQLKKGIYWEDEFILNYDIPSFWTLIENSVSKENFEKIRDLFGQNIKDTYKHSTMLNNLVKKISSEDKDEY